MGTARTYRQLAAASRWKKRLQTVIGIALLGAGLYTYSLFSIVFLLSEAVTVSVTGREVTQAGLTYFLYWTASIVSIIGGVVLVVLGLRR